MKPFSITVAGLSLASLLLGGCGGTQGLVGSPTMVTAGDDQAANLPARPHYTPQQYPTASQLPAVQEPTPTTRRASTRRTEASTRSAATTHCARR